MIPTTVLAPDHSSCHSVGGTGEDKGAHVKEKTGRGFGPTGKTGAP